MNNLLYIFKGHWRYLVPNGFWWFEKSYGLNLHDKSADHSKATLFLFFFCSVYNVPHQTWTSRAATVQKKRRRKFDNAPGRDDLLEPEMRAKQSPIQPRNNSYVCKKNPLLLTHADLFAPIQPWGGTEICLSHCFSVSQYFPRADRFSNVLSNRPPKPSLFWPCRQRLGDISAVISRRASRDGNAKGNGGDQTQVTGYGWNVNWKLTLHATYGDADQQNELKTVHIRTRLRAQRLSTDWKRQWIAFDGWPARLPARTTMAIRRTVHFSGRAPSSVASSVFVHVTVFIGFCLCFLVSYVLGLRYFDSWWTIILVF